tara:strand:+ start:74 stop:424 length:351 start_codon:yes stop_codon:yes gene_type:complete
VDSLLERFKEYGIDVSNLTIRTEDDMIMMYRSLQVYIEEILKDDVFEINFLNNEMIINDGFMQRVMTFSFSEDMQTMFADVNDQYLDKKMQNSLLSCFFLMIKDLAIGIKGAGVYE